MDGQPVGPGRRQEWTGPSLRPWVSLVLRCAYQLETPGRQALPLQKRVMSQADEFRAEIVAEESATVVRLTGEIDIAVAPHLRAALDRASEHARPIVVDMERVEFIDSVGIAVLLVAANRARMAQGEFALRNPTPAAQRVFDILSLNGQLPIEH